MTPTVTLSLKAAKKIWAQWANLDEWDAGYAELQQAIIKTEQKLRLQKLKKVK